MIDKLLSYNVIPEILLRSAVNWSIRDRANLEKKRQHNYKPAFLASMKASPLAISTDVANEQHYEVPTAFFQKVLGPHLKYSSGWWKNPSLKKPITNKTFAAAIEQSEEDMLRLTVERADIKNGDSILELGCGWGSLTLYLARNFRRSKITAVSNSKVQKAYLDDVIKTEKLKNLTVVCENVNNLELKAKFDRVISIEMFEHMRNYELLLKKISKHMKPKATLFVHIFCHREYLYPFSIENKDSWMAEFFFRDGIMPSFDIFSYFQNDLKVVESWKVNGLNYHYTAEAWFQKTVAAKDFIVAMYTKEFGYREAVKKWNYWKIFFLACSHLFRANSGKDWFVGHYLLSKSGK